MDTKSYLESVSGAAACSLVEVGGRESGAELSLLLFQSFRQRRQLPLQQQLFQSALLLDVQNGFSLLLQQLIALLLNLPDTKTFVETPAGSRGGKTGGVSGLPFQTPAAAAHGPLSDLSAPFQ